MEFLIYVLRGKWEIVFSKNKDTLKNNGMLYSGFESSGFELYLTLSLNPLEHRNQVACLLVCFRKILGILVVPLLSQDCLKGKGNLGWSEVLKGMLFDAHSRDSLFLRKLEKSLYPPGKS